MLCTASIAIGNKIKVQIKSGHEQYPNIYGLALLPPGEKKTPVGKVLLLHSIVFKKLNELMFKQRWIIGRLNFALQKLTLLRWKKGRQSSPAERDSFKSTNYRG